MSWERLLNEPDTSVFFKRTRKELLVFHSHQDDGEESKVLFSFQQKSYCVNAEIFCSKYFGKILTAR